jgi:hypothetical protein
MQKLVTLKYKLQDVQEPEKSWYKIKSPLSQNMLYLSYDHVNNKAAANTGMKPIQLK